MSTEQIYCSDHSLSLAEPVFASAPRIDAWILLEYPYPFTAKTFEESRLQDKVKTRLSAALASIPHSRLLMVKKSSKKDQAGFSLLLVKSSPEDRRMVRYRLERYADLLEVDIESSFTQAAPEQTAAFDPIILVCTNGKRDRCCARHGWPFFKEMEKFSSETVWQSSHMGGHRFAANVIHLPFGILYGRLSAPAARAFSEVAAKGQIDLPHYRGRTSYTAEQQAAEYYLRSHTGNTRIDDLQLVETRQLGESRWQVQFESKAGDHYSIRLHSELSEQAVIASCDAPHKRKQQLIYDLDEIS